MKQLNKINLVAISNSELEKAAQRLIMGGKVCECTVYCNSSCRCKYAGSQEGPDDSFHGGSSTVDNNNANLNDNAATTVGTEKLLVAYT